MAVHIIPTSLNYGETFRLGLMADLHWDNPKCQRLLLLEHLEYFKANSIPFVLIGDTFCLMQGKYDPRRSKKDIRPEHNVPNYLDAVVNTAAEFFKPYAHLIKVVGYGNHETAIIKNCETDPLERFTTKLGIPDTLGGYGGWIVVKIQYRRGQERRRYRIKYYHGAGGASPVTKGVIHNQRQQANTHGMDCFISGHVHNSYTMQTVVERLNINNRIELAEILHIRIPTYKEEYGTGYMGWHVERGAPPKPLGCYVLDLTLTKKGLQAVAKPLKV